MDHAENPIEIIKEKAEEADSAQAAFMEPGTKIKKARGRPRKDPSKKSESKKASEPEAPPKTEPQIPTTQIIRPAMQMLTDRIADGIGDPRAKATHDELEIMCQCLGGLIDKYAPDALSKYGLEITSVMVFGQYGLRVYSLKRAVDAEKRKVHPTPPPSPVVQAGFDESGLAKAASEFAN